MRGIGNHTPPENMQVEPDDNRTHDVMHQVAEWLIRGAIIHTEVAREIATWWQGPDRDGIHFAEFQSTGTIHSEFAAQVESLHRRVADRAEPWDSEANACVAALGALSVYLVNAGLPHYGSAHEPGRSDSCTTCAVTCFCDEAAVREGRQMRCVYCGDEECE